MNYFEYSANQPRKKPASPVRSAVDFDDYSGDSSLDITSVGTTTVDDIRKYLEQMREGNPDNLVEQLAT